MTRDSGTPVSLTAEKENIETKDDSQAHGTPWPLIGPEDPPPYSIYNPNGDAPFLIVCDHASRAFPKAMEQLGVADWVLDRHVAWDPGSADLGRAIADRFNAVGVLGGYSRLVMDMNRPRNHPTSIIPVSDGIGIPGNIDVSEAEVGLRTQSFFNPYHDAISEQLNLFFERGQVPALISVHTCTPVFDRVVRKWHVGVMWDKDPRIARPLIENLSNQPGVCVGDNEPYSGQHPNDFTIDYHAERVGLPCVGIEVRQDLVTDAEGVGRWAKIVGDALEQVLSDPELYQLVESN